MQGVAILLAIGSLLVIAGCTPELDECRRAYPEGSAAYNACWRAALQHQNEELNRQQRLNLIKGRD
jgi:hypothetical protein